MERDHLFKGKIKGSKTGHEEMDWAFGNLIKELSSGRCFICDLSHFDDDTKLVDVLIEVDPETVCQYTGLTDKNGRKIFEGDVIKAGGILVVKWSDKFAGWCLGKEGWLYNHFFGEACEPEDCEVIGNIFDNPELLNGEMT